MSQTLRLVSELNAVVIRVITFLMRLTPIGVGSLVLRSAASLDFADVGSSVGFHMITVITGLVLHAFILYPLLLLALACRNPIRYYANLVPAFATALGTSSS